MKIKDHEIRWLKQNKLAYCDLNKREQVIIEHLRKTPGVVKCRGSHGDWMDSSDACGVAKGLTYRIRDDYQHVNEPEPEFHEVVVTDGVMRIPFKQFHTMPISMAASIVGFAGFADADRELILCGGDELDVSKILSCHHDRELDTNIKYVAFRRGD